MTLSSCKKDSSNQSFSKNQELLTSKFSDLTESLGEIELSSIKQTNSTTSGIYLITANAKNSFKRKYLLAVDERQVNPKYERFIFETDMPSDLNESNYSKFSGFANFYSPDNKSLNEQFTFKKGIVVQTDSKANQLLLTVSEYEEVASPLTDCIKQALRKMSFGEWVLFIATEPESMAGLVLACAIDIIANDIKKALH